MEDGEMYRAGLYARVSTNDQQILTLQMRGMREYAAKRSWTIAFQIKEVPYRQSVNSARICLRPRRREIDVVLAWRLDRPPTLL